MSDKKLPSDRLDPFYLFSSYPSEILNRETNLYITKDITSLDIHELYKLKSIEFANPAIPNIKKIIEIYDIVNEKKSYNATLFLGEETDSLDNEGEIVKRKSVPKLNEDLVIKILNSFLGRYIQKPPMFSAKKVNGVRLYKLARKKIEVERDDQNCAIYDISLRGIENNIIEFAVTCSKGTYIRVLGSDIAKKIGTVGYLTKLTRTSIGKHSLSKSLTIKNFESKWKSTEN